MLGLIKFYITFSNRGEFYCIGGLHLSNKSNTQCDKSIIFHICKAPQTNSICYDMLNNTLIRVSANLA